MFWIIFIVCIVLFIFVLWKMKILKCGNMTLITGGIKTGKSALSVHCAYRTWKKNLFKAKLWNFLQIFRKKHKRRYKELPVLYSTVPLRCKYSPLTLDILRRNVRIPYGSVAYVCEASLMISSMDYKDDYLNEQLLLFNKLWAHYTRGGSIFYDTQSISDNHYAVKRCLSSYYYIHHNVKIPFIALVCFCREMKFSEDNSAINTIDKDLEDDLKMCIVPWSSLKLYDRYAFSALTDDLPLECTVLNGKRHSDLKARNIVTFKTKYKNLYEVNKK